MKSEQNWVVTVIQGVIAVALGLYLLLGGVQAAGIFGLVAAIYLLITGIFDLLRRRGNSIRYYRSIISVISGLVLLLLYFVDILPTTWDFTLLAIAVIIVGAMGLYTSFFDRAGKDFSWGAVLVNALLLLWGVLIFVSRVQDVDLQAISGWILIALGVVIALWGFFGRGRGTSDAAI
jgi:uncharacterized membrane protein HdeD (DUF308 family)